MSVATSSPEPIRPKAPRGAGAKASPRPTPQKTKVSIVLSSDVDFKLTVLAASRGVDRSFVVNQALEELTRGVVVSFRGKSADSTLTVTEDRQDAVA